MTNPILLTEAPKYWAKNLPVIPLRFKQKAPVEGHWSQFAERMPTEEEQARWLEKYPENNIGLALGPQSGIVCVDVDTRKTELQALVREVMSPSPWTRQGQKGWVWAFKYTGQRTFQIIDGEGDGVILELLSKGRQVVLPPSIHPDTNLPYRSDCNLYDLDIGALPELPRDFEALIRGALKHAGAKITSTGWTKVSTYVPAGARDNAMTAHAGILSRGIIRSERSLLEALSEMEEWVKSFTEKVAGDEMDIDKAKSKVIEFLVRDVTGERKLPLPAGWDEGLTDEDKEKLGLTFAKEQVQWTFDEITAHLKGESSRFPDARSSGWIKSVDYLLRRVADADLTKLEEDMVLKMIQEAGQGGMNMAGLRKMLVELRAGEIAGTDHSELAEVVLKELERFGEIRFDAGDFWQWKGAYYEKIKVSDIYKIISQEYGAYPAAKRSSDHGGIVKVMQHLRSRSLMDMDVVGLNFANGFVTEDLKLHEHDPMYGCTYVLPYRYLPEMAGRCPLFFRFLETSWGADPDYRDKVLAVQEALAASLFGLGTRFQRAICLFGRAGSGKSTLLDLLQAIAPPNVCSYVSPSDWGDRFMPAQMFGKLINIAGEISESKKIQGDVFKQIIDGTEMQAQNKGQPIFSFKPRCTQWFASNVLPKSADGTEGFNRRWLFLKFNKVVAEHEKVLNLAQLIAAEEREAIIAWALEAVERLIERRGYTIPSSHVDLIAQVANANNSVRFFLVAAPGIQTGVAAHAGKTSVHTLDTELYDQYYFFCTSSGGVKRVPLTTFQEQMLELAPQFGFSVEVTKNPKSNIPETRYKYLTLAKI